MRLLQVSTIFPFPPDDGDRLPIHHFLRLLADRAAITLLTLRPDAEDEWHRGRELLESWGVEVRAVCPRRRGGLVQSWQCLRGGRPWINRSFEPALAGAAGAALAEGGWDLVQAESIMSAQHLPRFVAAPSLLVQRDCLSHGHLMQTWERTRSPKAWLQQKKTVWMERSLFQRFDRIVTISEEERRSVLRVRPDARVSVVANGIDLERFRPDLAAEEAGAVVFSGAYNYAPNAEAMIHFGREVWPSVIRRCPSARLWIVGKHPTPGVSELAREPSIHVIGRVERMEEWLARAQVIVVPLLSGGGMKNKVMEAGAMARPMAVYPAALTGLALQPEHDLLLARTPAEMADAVVRLLNDAEQRRRLGSNARAVIEREYSWETNADRLWAVYQELAGRPGRAPFDRGAVR